METVFCDKAVFDSEIIQVVQSNEFPPPSNIVDKFETSIKGAFPKLSIEKGKYKPQQNGAPPTLQQLGLLPKKALSVDDMFSMIVKNKFETNNTQSTNQLTPITPQSRSNDVSEGSVNVKCESYVVTVFFGPNDPITVDSLFFEVCKVIGPTYNKEKEERIFYIKSVSGGSISMSKEQTKQHTLAYVLRICGLKNKKAPLEVLSAKRNKVTNGYCSD